MSKLYDDASLMMIPSSVKDGKLYSILPQPKPLSGELVTNGDFDTDSDWTSTNATIENGNLVLSSTANVYQNIGLVIGKKYKIKYDIVSINAGSSGITAFAGSSAGTTRTQVGPCTDYIEASGSGLLFFFTGGGFVSGKIDNVSVVEVDQLPADFDFSRGSNLAATRINEQGLIEKGRENLLLQSNNFDTSPWTGGSTIFTSGQSGYDGSNDAWLLTHPLSTNSTYQLNTNSGVQTFSIYAKSDGSTGIRLYAFGDANANAYFDLNNGVVRGPSNVINSDIVSVGNGWYRCSITFNQTNTTLRIYTTNNVTTSAAGSVYIQDAQLEVGLVATDYIESGATTGKAGVLEDLPRLNWGDCPSLLLEPSRSNYVPYSEKLDGNSRFGGTFYPNQVISPDGTLNAYGIDQDDTSNRIQPNIGAYDGLVTMSMYIKPVATIAPRLNIYNASNGSLYGAVFYWDGSDFTIASYASGNSGAGYEDVGNGWYRLWVVGTSISGGTVLAQFRYNTDSDISNRLYIWGLQAERGSYATSYIPAHGTSVTRAAENTNSPTSSSVAHLIGQTEGTVFIDVEYLDGALDDVFMLNRSSVDSIGVSKNNNSLTVRVYQNGTSTNTVGNTTADSFKLAVTYNSNGVKMFINGALNVNNEFAISFSSLLNSIYLSANPFYVSRQKKNIKQFAVFPIALSDNECINLTTI